MQYCVVNKQTNKAVLIFRMQDLADFLGKHRGTIFNQKKQGNYFHIEGYDIYVFNYRLPKNVNNLTDIVVPESRIFNRVTKLKQEEIALAVKNLFNQISIMFISISYCVNDDKMRTASNAIIMIDSILNIISNEYEYEISLLKSIRAEIEEYYAIYL